MYIEPIPQTSIYSGLAIFRFYVFPILTHVESFDYATPCSQGLFQYFYSVKCWVSSQHPEAKECYSVHCVHTVLGARSTSIYLYLYIHKLNLHRKQPRAHEALGSCLCMACQCISLCRQHNFLPILTYTTIKVLKRRLHQFSLPFILITNMTINTMPKCSSEIVLAEIG